MILLATRSICKYYMYIFMYINNVCLSIDTPMEGNLQTNLVVMDVFPLALI